MLPLVLRSLFLLLLLHSQLADAMGREVQVQLSAKNKGECGQDFRTYAWIPRAVLPALGMPSKTCVSHCGSIEVTSQQGDKSSYNLAQINVADGHDVCGACNCDLAYIALVPGEQFEGLRCGVYASISYSTKPGPYKPGPAPAPHPPGPAPPPPPPPVGVQFDFAGIHLELAEGSGTVQSLNKSVPVGGTWNKTNNFSFVGAASNSPRTGCPMLGDINIRVAPVSAGPSSKGGAAGAMGTPWAIFDSAFGDELSWRGIKNSSNAADKNVLMSHDITAVLNSSQTSKSHGFEYNSTLFDGDIPVKVVRSYEKSADGEGIILRFKLTNTWKSALKLGGLGFAMPQAGMQHGIEESVWYDPHIGGDHGFVEWVRVVVDEQTLLATAEGSGSGMEGWRPILEGCTSDDWEWAVHTRSWADEWSENKQFPFLQMSPELASAVSAIDNKTVMWKKPHLSPWPSWHGHETVPLTDFEGIAAPWNHPTEGTLEIGETKDYAIRLTMATAGPRTRNSALTKAGRSVLQAVPGYVLSPDMTTAKLHVTPPAGVSVESVNVSDPTVMTAKIVPNTTMPTVAAAAGVITVDVSSAGLSKRGRCRLSLLFSDGSVNYVHYSVLPRLKSQVAAVGRHWAEDAWLPLEYEDPFGRAASVMPYDRHDRTHVLDDSRAYDVGLSDDAGGGNPLGFAIKVAYAPTQFEVNRLDDYVKWTLYGIKTPENCPECHAKPPYKSLQIRPEDCIPALGKKNGSQCGNEDNIRMTMYYYDTDDKAYNWSGHWPYNYSEADKIGARGIEGGPNWPMTESMANATYRAFNFPHHVTTYLALYYAARNTELKTAHSWDWYLMRAANTTLKFGAPSVGVMDDTTFREILRAVVEEAEADPARHDFAVAAANITANMYSRACGRFSEPYPYGSEFAFDTTGQEAVVVWLLYFANSTNHMEEAAKETVDHILSYMRSSGTWAYNGGSRSWGDLGNNGKWQVTSGTNFETRGNFHYRSGLNAIPLLEWYRGHPDDYFLLEPALGAIAGQMNNIDERGAPSMMMHMEPHILEFDPHSGDFGLGFFGCSVQSAAYYVEHPDFGPSCYLCNLEQADTGTDGLSTSAVAAAKIVPADLYHRRVYLEPLALYVTLDVGTFASLTLDMTAKKLIVSFNPMAIDNITYTARRLRVDKVSEDRPGSDFRVEEMHADSASVADGRPPALHFERGAFVVPQTKAVVQVTWK